MLCLCGCSRQSETTQIVATTLPVYEFAAFICEGTNITVSQLITEDISCLHNYTLKVNQMRTLENAKLTLISGAGLEDFLTDALYGSNRITDVSVGIDLIHNDHAEHTNNDTEHHHDADPHYWLSPENAKLMANNILEILTETFPENTEIFAENHAKLTNKLQELQNYGSNQLSNLPSKEIITFHDGFAYFAKAFDLNILKSIEEESGAEASAAELIELINLVNDNQLPAIFVEKNGSDSAASVVARETNTNIFPLDMCISGNSYFNAMYQNINTIKEALE